MFSFSALLDVRFIKIIKPNVWSHQLKTVICLYRGRGKASYYDCYIHARLYWCLQSCGWRCSLFKWHLECAYYWRIHVMAKIDLQNTSEITKVIIFNWEDVLGRFWIFFVCGMIWFWWASTNSYHNAMQNFYNFSMYTNRIHEITSQRNNVHNPRKLAFTSVKDSTVIVSFSSYFPYHIQICQYLFYLQLVMIIKKSFYIYKVQSWYSHIHIFIKEIGCTTYW